MKVKLLVGRVSADGSHAPGEEISVDDREAYTLITSGQAEPKVKKEFAELEKRIEKLKKEEEEKEAKLVAIQREEQLKESASALLDELVKVVDTIASVSPEYRDAFLASFHERFTPRGEAE